MDTSQYRLLKSVEILPHGVSVEDLPDTSDRTLIYGYTYRRSEFHVYLKDNIIHILLSGPEGETLHHSQGSSVIPEYCVPDGRVFPEACDFDFCKILRSKGNHIPFTAFDENRKPERFYGRVV